MSDFKHIEELLKMKREALKKFDDHMAMSIITTRQADNGVCGIIREEIDYLTNKINYALEDIKLDDAFLTYRLADVVNKNPEHYLNMMEPRDIERYLRKKKLEQIKKPSNY